MIRRLHLTISIVVFLFLQLAFVRLSWGGDPFSGRATAHKVFADDGASLYIFELHGNQSGPVILLEPGVLETAEALEGVAEEFHRRGFNVFVGQVRLAGRGEYVSGDGPTNGLEDVLLKDFPAHFRGVLNIVGPNRPIQLLGHSMGGLEILATFSDVKLAQEFSPHVGAVSLVGVPHHTGSLSPVIRAQSYLLLKVFKLIRSFFDAKTFGPHRTFFNITQKMKASGSKVQAILASQLENQFMAVGNLILDTVLIDVDQTSAVQLRRFWFEKVSRLPLELLIDFAETAIRGKFRKKDHSEMIVPERIVFPIQVVRGEHDQLAKWDDKKLLLELVSSKIRRLVNVYEMKHVSLILSDLPHAFFFDKLVDFHENPDEIAKSSPELNVTPKPGCSRVLVQP